jgi:hypothetical protein
MVVVASGGRNLDRGGLHKTPLSRTMTFADPEKIREQARRGEAWGASEARQMLEYAIEMGRGEMYLRLTARPPSGSSAHRGGRPLILVASLQTDAWSLGVNTSVPKHQSWNLFAAAQEN